MALSQNARQKKRTKKSTKRNDKTSTGARLGALLSFSQDWAAAIFGDVDAAACPVNFAFGQDDKLFYVSGPHDSQLSWLMTALFLKQGGHSSVVAAQVDEHSAELGLRLPATWRQSVLANDSGRAFYELLGELGGQLIARQPKLAPYYEAGFKILVNAADADEADLEARSPSSIYRKSFVNRAGTSSHGLIEYMTTSKP